jgi:cell division protein FtsZ
MVSTSKNHLHRAKKINILIIGLGGGGGMIVSYISQKIKGARFIVADTDAVNLGRLKNKELKTMILGEELTQGLGTGRDIHLAKKAAQEAEKQIGQIFKGIDLVVFVSCLGGGVGSGALPVFTQSAQVNKVVSLGIFTSPFKFEGKKKQKIAQQSLGEAIPYLDAYLVIPDDKIFSLVKGGTFQEAFALVNTHVINWLESIIYIIRKPGLINIDFSDLKAILKGKEKKLFLNRTRAQGEHRLEKIQKEIGKNTLGLFPLEAVKKILFYTRGGADLKMAEVEAISQKIKNLNPGAKIIFGLDKEKGMKGQLEVTLLALMGEKEKSKKKKSIKKRKARSLKKTGKKKGSQLKIVRKVKRRNALEIKQESQKEEAEKTPQEKEWEIPAFLRRK